MKIKWKTLLLCILTPLAVGGLAAWLTKDSMEAFSRLRQPPLSPPGWVFGVVWGILYTLMGIASYLVCVRREDVLSTGAMKYYGVQLAFNFLWTLIFFRFEAFLLAFCWLLALWVLILATTLRFGRVKPAAGWLMVPYLVWVSFAGYLNFGIWLLNRQG